MIHSSSPAVEPWLAAAGDFLRTHPVEHTVLLDMADRQLRGVDDGRDHSEASWYWLTGESGEVVAVALMTRPGFPYLSSMASKAARALAEHLYGGTPLTGVGGVGPAVAAFGARWTELTGQRALVKTRLAILEATRVAAPAGVPGLLRRAGSDDRDAVVAWTDAFRAYIDNPPQDPAIAMGRVERGQTWLWCVEGVPVSMACITEPHAGVARIAPVYTPDELRGRGYASALTAALTARTLALGSRVVLFADLDDTAARIYRAIGYRDVVDAWDLEFIAGS